MSYSRRELYALGEPLGNSATQLKADGGRIYGGGGDGDGGGGTTQSTSYSTNLPEYAQPYYQELLKQTGREVFTTDASGNVTGMKPGSNVPQQSVAGFNPLQTQVQNQVAGMQTPGQFAQSTTGLTGGQNLGFNTAQRGINQAFSYRPDTINAERIQAPQLYNYQMQGPQNVAAMGVGTQNFGQGAADYYMSPFAQAAIDPALREARLQGNLQKQQGMLGAIGRGTFGGARQALLQAEQERGTQRTMADIQATGMEKAYQNAQAQFQADQARQLQAQQANQQYGLQAQLANQQAGLTTGQQNLQALLGVQQLGAGQSLESQRANQAAALQAAQLNQQGQQFGATLGSQLGLAGLQAGVDTSKALGALGSEQQQADLARLTAQGAAGAERQSLAQRQADTDYQNQMARQNFARQQLQFYSDILRGNAGALGSTQVQYAPAPSQASQIAGLGLAGLGLAKALG